MAKIVSIGPAYPYRGGIAAFNERLVAELQKEGHTVDICTFTLQYPSFLFPGKTQYSEGKAPEGIQIKRRIHSCNPFNWIQVGNIIKKQKPDVVLFHYWLPFMSPAFGTIARIIKKNRHTKIIGIIDNMIPHEKRLFDTTLSKYFVKKMDAFLAMSQKVLNDIRLFKPNTPLAFSPHPLYDNYGHTVSRTEAIDQLKLSQEFRYILFFGLIRDYKGLDLLIEAFSDERIRLFPVKLLVAGEFYSDPEPYHAAIHKHHLSDGIQMTGKFIPDDLVKYYFCAADLVVQPYKSATQSGITQIAYHFEKPMVVTKVGGLPEIVPDGKAGYVVEPEPKAIADAIVDFYQSKPNFSKGIIDEKQKYQWSRFTAVLLELYDKIK